MKILIIFYSGIGNFILFTPTLRAIRTRYSSAEITLCVKERIVLELLKGRDLVDRTVHISKSGPASKFSFIYEQRMKGYDLVITTFDARGWKLALMVHMIRAKESIGYKNGRWYDNLYTKALNDDPSIHEVDRHLKIAECLGAGKGARALEIYVADADRRAAAQLIPEDARLVIGIHPGCSSALAKKRWMPGRFAELADRLAVEFEARIIIMGGPEETGLAEEIEVRMRTDPVILAGRTSLRQTAAAIEKCNLFISNDSGLMHVSSAVKTPAVAVFGPTNPVKNTPWGEGHIVIRKDLHCSPCAGYDTDECTIAECLQQISVGDVFNIVKERLLSMGFRVDSRMTGS